MPKEHYFRIRLTGAAADEVLALCHATKWKRQQILEFAASYGLPIARQKLHSIMPGVVAATTLTPSTKPTPSKK